MKRQSFGKTVKLTAVSLEDQKLHFGDEDRRLR
jgi:hypothetical protein